MLDGVGLVHMNGRVYDPEIGRFLSADPHIQEAGNFQNWNRYSYVLNNPLSYTDPSGFFFSGLFKSIGKMFANLFRAVGNVLKQALKSGIFRSILQIVACSVLPGVGCALASGVMSLLGGGSIGDALRAFAFSFAQIGIDMMIGPTMNALAATGIEGAFAKAGIHGAISGALSVAQGGSFAQGFAGAFAGVMGGYMAGQSGAFGSYGDGVQANQLARALISAAAGCAGAVVSGGKCAQAALTAAFASLYNGDSPIHKPGYPSNGGPRLETEIATPSAPSLLLRAFGPLGWFVLGTVSGTTSLNIGEVDPMPPFTGGKTTGVLNAGDGHLNIFTSGWDGGPGPSMPKGSPGFDIVTRTHVEGHAAAYMNLNGISEGTLWINNPAVCESCLGLLPRMLAPGSLLQVIPRGGLPMIFKGLPR